MTPDEKTASEHRSFLYDSLFIFQSILQYCADLLVNGYYFMGTYLS